MPPKSLGRTVSGHVEPGIIEWIQPREPRGGWTDLDTFEPEPIQPCYSVGRPIHENDCMKAVAASAMPVGDEDRVMLSNTIEIPARCVVRIVRFVRFVEEVV